MEGVSPHKSLLRKTRTNYRPIISLLLAVEALYQAVSNSKQLERITLLDYTGLVIRAINEGLGDARNTIRDTIAFAEGLLLVDRYIETLSDDVLKQEVQTISNAIRPTPQTPLSGLSIEDF
ncbi:hypothetical protein N7501_007173 [Penicillium viridicatum]|nr:hypothetical protein N7501_007173 [Penicillium viridicatum]